MPRARPADLRRVCLIEPVATRDCPNEARETIDQRVPSLLVPPCGPSQEAADVDVVHMPTVATPHVETAGQTLTQARHARLPWKLQGSDARPHSWDIIVRSLEQLGASEIEVYTGDDLFVTCNDSRGLRR